MDSTRIACPLCFREDTLVSVNNNLIPITQLNVHVDGLWHDSKKKSQKIIESFQRDYTGDILKLKVRFLPPVFVTPKHPVMVRHLCKPYKRKTNHRMCGMPFIFKKAEDLTHGDFVVIPRDYCRSRKHFLHFQPYLKSFSPKVPLDISNNSVVLDEEWAELMGWYLAEGHSTSKEVVFSLNKNETVHIDRIRELAKLIGYSTYISNGTATQIHLTSRILPRAFVEWFGKGARNKKVPDFITQSNHRIRLAFLNAYFKGDGYYDTKRGRQVVSSASKLLMQQIQLLGFQEGICFSFREFQRGGVIAGRILPPTKLYRLESTSHPRYALASRRFIYLPISKIERQPFNGKVYNIKTEDGMYQVPFVVHNCGWWRTLDFGINADGTPREVRFDKVNPATSLLLRVERLQGHGREKGKSEILLIDAKGILSIDPKFLHQIRTQCHKILDVIEGRTDAKPEPFVPTTPKPVTKFEPKKKEVVKKKKPPAEKKEQPAPTEKPVKREKPPEPESMGVWDSYDERSEAEAARTKAIKRSPEFEWRIQETKGKNYKPQFDLWYFANPEPVKEKPAVAKKPAAKTATKSEPVSEQYSQKEIDDAQSILSQIQTVLNEE